MSPSPSLRAPLVAAIATTALGAALLFMVQPIIGRAILPWYGGTPAVWTTCLLFFQTALLAGYAWAHWAARRSAWIHLGLIAVALLSLPIMLDPALQPTADAQPVSQILWTLSLTVGLPYIALAATAPWVQARLAAAGQVEVHRLYAWSNGGSLVGLLAFPFLIEPAMGVRVQAWAWSGAFGLYALCLAGVARTSIRAPAPSAVKSGAAQVGAAEPGIVRRTVARWVGWSACGSALLMAMTEVLCQDLSVTPLLWVLPLTAYLLSFVLAFGSARLSSRRLFGPLFVLALVGVVVLLNLGYRAGWLTQLLGWCAAIFVCCTLCHGELVRSRPADERLTGFYLWMALGGALGGVFVGVIAPLIFTMHLELHLALLLAWALFVTTPPSCEAVEVDTYAGNDARRLGLWLLSLALLGALGHHAWSRNRGDATLYRSFFGVLQVKTYTTNKGSRIRNLLDGRISHGYQFVEPPRSLQPTAYFGPTTGIGQQLGAPGVDRRIGVVGLGVGTLAAYGRAGDQLWFFEINPDVITVAERHFTYLGDSAADVQIVLGDGRQAIAQRPQMYDVLVLDAFSGDAIPTHLLTVEAFALYLSRLAPDGVLAVNVSNRHADLSRVARGLAAEHGLAWRWRRAHAKSPFGRYRSDWMVLARSAELLTAVQQGQGPTNGAPKTGTPLVWTDDYAPLLPLMRDRGSPKP